MATAASRRHSTARDEALGIELRRRLDRRREPPTPPLLLRLPEQIAPALAVARAPVDIEPVEQLAQDEAVLAFLALARNPRAEPG